MYCKSCGQEIGEDSLFCSKCGEKQNAEENIVEVSGENSDTGLISLPKPKKWSILLSKKRKVLLFSIFGLSILVCVIVVAMNPTNSIKRAIEKNNYSKAVSVYNDKIKGRTDKELQITEKLNKEVENIILDFTNDKNDYNDANTKLTTIKNIGLLPEISSSISKFESMNQSKIAYKKATEFKKVNNYLEALIEFNKVIENDPAFSKAKDEISNISNKYKSDIISQIDEVANSENYDEAIRLTSEALRGLSSDAELLAKQDTYKKLNEEKITRERKSKMDELYNQQEMYAISSKVYKDWIGWDNIQVIVKNNTDKVAKKYTVRWLCYDINGYPIQTGFGAVGYLDGGIANNTVHAGQTFGSGYGWRTNEDSGAKTVIACVEKVVYYDESEWINPYYDYWLEEYLEKPLR